MPDFGFVKKAYKMEKDEFIATFDRRVKEIDLKYMARDVEPFLFEEQDIARVKTFAHYWGSVKKNWLNPEPTIHHRDIEGRKSL